MTAVVREHATYDDLVALPENMVGEIIEGELYAWPRPSGRHGHAATVLGMILGPPFHLRHGGPGGWWIIYEPEVHFGRRPDVLVPDLAGWHRERMAELPTKHIFSVVPDWVCEVLSGSTARVDRSKKLPIYARHGVPYAWLVDTEAQTLEVKKLINGLWTDIAIFVGDDRVRAEPFDAIEFELSLVWGSPAAPV